MTKKQLPDTIARVWKRSVDDALIKAYAFIAMSKAESVSNIALAGALEMDPRGLRQVLEKDGRFIVEMRGTDRGTVWYAINPDHPPYALDKEIPPRIITSIKYKRS